MMKTLPLYILVCMLILSCSPSTEITGSWKNQGAVSSARPLNTILVTALTARTNVRQTVEDDIARSLSKEGFSTIKSFDLLPPFTEGKAPTKDELFAKINESNADAILTVALIDKETESRYVPGNAAYAPIPRFGYYGNFWGYYNNWFPSLHSPGYYEETKTYFIETNLYDAKTEELLWSGQSETYDPGSLTTFSKEFSKVVVARMNQDGVLRADESEMAKQRNQ